MLIASTIITGLGLGSMYGLLALGFEKFFVDRALMQYGKKTYGTKKAGLMLINNPWGESNEKGLKAANDPANHSLKPVR